MDVKRKSRLPGVYFQAEPPPLEEKLPRMDITAFVGLASSGPVDVPVPVEDTTRFRDIFGPNLELAWDPTARQMQHAYLGSAVEAFPLPGLKQAKNGQPAYAWARCAGSWSDELRVGTVLQSRSLRVDRFKHEQKDSKATTVFILDLVAGPTEIRVGDLLCLTFIERSTGSALVLFLVATALEAVPPVQRVTAKDGYWFMAMGGSPPTPQGATDFKRELVSIKESAGLDWLKAWQASGSPPEEKKPSVERLTFDLWVWKRESNTTDFAVLARLSDLAFSKQHTRFWAGLPSDAELFQSAGERFERTTPSELYADASEPRFPLAGPEKNDRAELYLPLGMPVVPNPTSSKGPLNDIEPSAKLERDGLKDFCANLFLDSALNGTGAGALLREANHRRYVLEQPLRGIHSLLPVGEVTLVAVPDAVHRGWQETEARLPAPVLHPISDPDAQGNYTVSWSVVEPATGYIIQEDSDPSFPEPEIRSTKWEVFLVAGPAKDGEGLYYRVRAERMEAKHGGKRAKTATSEWSNTEQAPSLTLRPDFEECPIGRLKAPVLEPVPLASPPGDALHIHWRDVPGATRYTLQQAFDAEFETAVIRYTGDGTVAPLERRGDEISYYRVRAERDGESSPWSNIQSFVPTPGKVWTIKSPREYRDTHLVAVHRALLRFCAARGDLLAIMTLPSHYREEETLRHLTALVAQAKQETKETNHAKNGNVPPLTPGEDPVLSYGAIFHPWIVTNVEASAGTSNVRLIPADGTACGSVAALAVARGAWVAPANDPLAGVVSLEPAMDREVWLRLREAQANVVRQDPRGFMLLSADTLSQEDRLRPINVRRLLILLRRLALREGTAYVFQPNDEGFRRLVQRRFERLLANLYTRGAFRGATAMQAYQVATDRSMNTPASIDRGRFIVELRVAPSRPLEFITVRLVQTDQEALAIQEI
jgi:hypothetical protein